MTVNNDTLNIRGFVTMHKEQVLVTTGAQRFIPESYDTLVIEVPSGAELGLEADVPASVTALIRVNTTRHSSEWATDFIKRGRPFVFELDLPSGGSMAADDIATLLVEAFTQWEAKFIWADNGLPFTWTIVNNVITLTTKAGYLTLHPEVIFHRKFESKGFVATTSRLVDSGVVVDAGGALAPATVVPVTDATVFKVGDTVSFEGNATEYTIIDIDVLGGTITLSAGLDDDLVGAEVINVYHGANEPVDGKYLEENVVMGTFHNTDLYAVGPNETPILSAPYAQVTIYVQGGDAGGIDLAWKQHKSMLPIAGANNPDHTHSFVIYLNESTTFGVNGPAQVLIEWLESCTNVDFSKNTFKLANGTAAADSAEWLA